MVLYTLRMPARLIDAIKRRAAERSQTVSVVIRDLLEFALGHIDKR